MQPLNCPSLRIVVGLGIKHLISKGGTIEDLKVVSRHPLLVPSALEAVEQLVYQPTLLDGETVG